MVFPSAGLPAEVKLFQMFFLKSSESSRGVYFPLQLLAFLLLIIQKKIYTKKMHPFRDHFSLYNLVINSLTGFLLFSPCLFCFGAFSSPLPTLACPKGELFWDLCSIHLHSRGSRAVLGRSSNCWLAGSGAGREWAGGRSSGV